MTSLLEIPTLTNAHYACTGFSILNLGLLSGQTFATRMGSSQVLQIARIFMVYEALKTLDCK
jgi:hypothetical protein